ncbi:MAG: glycosyltransferase [Deltaproteobacteria bacterium]|nr:glycosyltransferase [Deltaproteobacteria bacterium]
MELSGRVKKGVRLLKSGLSSDGLKRLVFSEIPRMLSRQSPDAAVSFLGAQATSPLRCLAAPKFRLPPRRQMEVDVVICVHNALSDLKNCIASVLKNSSKPCRLILVNDGSDHATSSYLRDISKEHFQVLLSERQAAGGYTKAANAGLALSSAPVVVLLNSDTIVPSGWLEKIEACFLSDSGIGLCGPLSNAASWQSIPERFDGAGDWIVNELPEGLDVDAASQLLEVVSPCSYPRLPLLNGFCLALKREVIETLGGFDEESFPNGYGEENDYCLRAAQAGFTLALCDNLYIYHAKSKSYSHKKRRKLAEAGHAVLTSKYPMLESYVSVLREQPDLERLRQRFATLLHLLSHSEFGKPSILFLLPSSAGGGGVNSIVQEAEGLQLLGVDVRIAARSCDRFNFAFYHREAFAKRKLFLFYENEEELLRLSSRFNIAVATLFTSAGPQKRIVNVNGYTMPAYYVQDYEPFFFDSGHPDFAQAFESYGLVPGNLLFAKTDWIAATVQSRHGLNVQKVSPSLDHYTFRPVSSRRTAEQIVLCAMIRPGTARRGAPQTMRIFSRLKREFSGLIDIHIFGCSHRDIGEHQLVSDFSFKNHGRIDRDSVAKLMAASDIFLDLSTYQAFGRTGLEAMACGCAVVLPREGGVYEYAKDKINALLVDTQNEEECYLKAKLLVENHDIRRGLIQEGLETAAHFSVIGAALSEYEILSESWSRFLTGKSLFNGDISAVSLPYPKLSLDYIGSKLGEEFSSFFKVRQISAKDLLKKDQNASILFVDVDIGLKKDEFDELLECLRERAENTPTIPTVVIAESGLSSDPARRWELARLSSLFLFQGAYPFELCASHSMLIPKVLDEETLCHRILEAHLRKTYLKKAQSDSCPAKSFEERYYDLLGLVKKVKVSFDTPYNHTGNRL